MTNTQKVAGASALAIVLSLATLLLSSQSLPVLQFLFGEMRTFAALPLFGPVTVAVIVGAVAPAWLPYLLPECWPSHRTKRVTRLLGFGTAFAMVAVRYPSMIGVQYGLFAGSGAYMLWSIVAGFVYRRLPRVTPPSLVDPPEQDGGRD